MAYTPSTSFILPSGSYTPSSTFVWGEPVTLVVPTYISIFDPFTLSIPTHISIFDLFTLSIPTSITGISTGLHMVIPVSISGFATYDLTIPTSITVQSTQLTLSIPITLTVFPGLSLTIPTRVTVLPLFATGGIIDLPSEQSWSLQVLLDGVDISARLTGQVSVDKEENSAAVAVFAIRPTVGSSVDPYAWYKASVEVIYKSLVPSAYSVTLFKGIVDTPVFNAVTRVTEFTCTDQLQNKVNDLTHTQVDALTPLSKWSKDIYDSQVNSWDYLQQRLETYPYAVDVSDSQGIPRVYSWVAALSPLYSFDESTVIDNSISVSLANAKDIVNYFEVSVDHQHTQYRETVVSFEWEETGFPSSMDFFTCDPQMIVDAVSQSGAQFFNFPTITMIPATAGYSGSGGSFFVLVNNGSELQALAFSGYAAKRYTQNVKNTSKVIVQNQASVTSLGRVKDSLSSSISSEIDTSVDRAFTETTEVTRYWCTAHSHGTMQGRPTEDSYYTDPFLGVTDSEGHTGFVPYPRLPLTFSMYTDGYSYSAQNSLLGPNLPALNLNISDYKIKASTSTGFTVTGTTPTGYDSGVGEYFYDFDSKTITGTSAERLLALEVLKAKASTVIKLSHRKNKVTFASFIQPWVARGQTLKVDHSSLVAQGIVSQLVHNFDIDNGSATTNITLSLSSPKTIGALDTTGTIPAEVLATKAPVADVVVGYTKVLGSHHHTGSVNSAWEGHITPKYPYPDLTHKFVYNFPEIPEDNTNNFDTVSTGATYNVEVPQDLLLLYA